jgi:ketosteroid isomerase-like protein
VFGRDPARVARHFVEGINARDLQAIAELVGDRCKIIDARGDWMEGRETCLEGMERLFAIDPDYRIHVETIGRSGDNVLITGHATASDPRFATTTLWRALADGQHLHEWQSYSHSRGPSVARLLVGDKAQMGPFLEGTP